MNARSPEILELLTKIEVGRAIPFGPLAAVPLLRTGTVEDGADADLLEEGISDDRTTVTEVDADGVVERVRVHHRGPKPLLLLHGEEVVGAKQNRAFIASFVVAPGVEVELPVSCVERGRWGYASPTFRSPRRTISSGMRRSTLSRCADSVTEHGAYDADQSAVWSDVDDYLRRSRTSSRTSSYADAFESRRAEAEALAASLALPETAVGFAFFRGSASGTKLVGLDVFGSSSLFARAFHKISAGVAADVLTPRARTEAPVGDVRPTEIGYLLRAIADRAFVRTGVVGGTETLHGAGDPTAAAAGWGGRIFHLFAAEGAGH